MQSPGNDLIERARMEKAPLIAGDQATFVWVGEHAPTLAGDITGWRPWETTSGGQKMAEVESAIWTCTLALPPDAYVEYAYFLDGQRVYDPFNPHRVPNGFEERFGSFYPLSTCPGCSNSGWGGRLRTSSGKSSAR